MRSGRKAVIVAIAGVVAGFGIFLLVANIAGEADANLGDDTFEVGDAERLAELIARDGEPLVFGDVGGGDRQIFVHHVGREPHEGWLAFDAVVDGCPLRWDAEQEVFEDTCTGDVYDREGSGLHHYPTEVNEDGDVVVDLRAGR